MSIFDSVIGAVRKFSPKKSGLSEVKQSIEPAPAQQIRLPSEDILKSYESRYESQMPPKTPIEALREPQLPQEQIYRPVQSPISSKYPTEQSYPSAAQTTNQTQPMSPKIDLILAEIETVKAQLKVLSEKMDILESHYRR